MTNLIEIDLRFFGGEGVEFFGCCVSLYCMANRNDIERLFKSHYAQMYRLAVVLLHDYDLARDIVHDVFVPLLDGRGTDLVSGGYLMRAVRNRCLNHIRDCESHQLIEHRYFYDKEKYDTEAWPDEETLALINNLISGEISPQSRRIMELRFSEGMSFSLIATEMGISETAVYRHLSQALKFIRKKLSENG